MEIRNLLCWGYVGIRWLHREPQNAQSHSLWKHKQGISMSTVATGLKVVVGIGELGGRFQLSRSSGFSITQHFYTACIL